MDKTELIHQFTLGQIATPKTETWQELCLSYERPGRESDCIIDIVRQSENGKRHWLKTDNPVFLLSIARDENLTAEYDRKVIQPSDAYRRLRKE